MHVARPASRSRSAVAALTVLCATFVAPAPAATAGAVCASSSAVPTEADRAALERATLCLLNAQRTRRGLGLLRVNRQLARAANIHAADMERRNYFSHVSLSGASFVDRIRGTGYLRGVRTWRLAENIGWGAGGRASPRAVVSGWMKSPGHRAIILSSAYREIGIGLATGAPRRVRGGRAATYATDFGARA